MAQYKNYKELAEAFETGELNNDQHQLVVEKDICYLEWKDQEGINYNDEFSDCKLLFAHGKGYADIPEILDAGNIHIYLRTVKEL